MKPAPGLPKIVNLIRARGNPCDVCIYKGNILCDICHLYHYFALDRTKKFCSTCQYSAQEKSSKECRPCDGEKVENWKLRKELEKE